MAKTKAAAEHQAVYTKAQIAVSKRYANRRDAVGALLEEDKTYTLNEVDAKMEAFMKGKVR